MRIVGINVCYVPTGDIAATNGARRYGLPSPLA
jgi:hypothetical protein